MKVSELRPFEGQRVQVSLPHKNTAVGILQIAATRCTLKDITIIFGGKNPLSPWSTGYYFVGAKSIKTIMGVKPSDIYEDFLPKEEIE